MVADDIISCSVNIVCLEETSSGILMDLLFNPSFQLVGKNSQVLDISFGEFYISLKIRRMSNNKIKLVTAVYDPTINQSSSQIS